ncbi:hypothetical protein [Streptomyces sp. NPDC058401]|uniref:hypothetical protein n=1 Tax=Streptomyces sp. NPDC058401 TaxID=3346480 RepID=UPI00365079C4
MAAGSTKSSPSRPNGGSPSREASPSTTAGPSPDRAPAATAAPSATTIRRRTSSPAPIRNSGAHAARNSAPYPQCALDRMTSSVSSAASPARAALSFAIS